MKRSIHTGLNKKFMGFSVTSDRKAQTNFLANPIEYTSLSLKYWRRQWHPTPVLLPGKSHGWRSLVGCSPWRGEESDMTEPLHFHFSLSYIGEGNGNPLQCSCLEHPRDGGAWWAALYGVAQSWKQLKELRSSSCFLHVGKGGPEPQRQFTEEEC